MGKKLFAQQLEYKNIDGNWTKKTPIGYCLYTGHKGYLTTAEFKTHNCIKKHCKLLILNPKHPEYSKYIRNKNMDSEFYKLIKRQLDSGEINQYKYENLCKFTNEQQRSYLNNVENNKKQNSKYDEARKLIASIEKRQTIWQRIKNFFTGRSK